MSKIAKFQCSDCAMIAYGKDVESFSHQIDDELFCNFCHSKAEIILITEEQHEKEKRQFINNIRRINNG